jgi:hypothetical protein
MLTFLSSMLFSTQVFAQDFEEEESKKKGYQIVDDKRTVREVERGWYAKSNIGGSFYFGGAGSNLRAGTTLSMIGGQDVIDRENMSVSWEAGLITTIHNGNYYEEQIALSCGTTQTCLQGDSRTFLFSAVGEYSYYPDARFGIGVRAGGGIMSIPLLMDQNYYEDKIASDPNFLSSAHQGMKPTGLGGLTFEYYTKLSHFSIGLDADFMFVVGIGPGANTNGYFKYTF